jgi:hypothetical protein
MEITVKVAGITLTMSHETDQDLTKFEVEQRIQQVMTREARRFAEIIAVGLKDEQASHVEAARIKSLRSSGEKRGPNIILAAGTKDPKAGRFIDEK